MRHGDRQQHRHVVVVAGVRLDAQRALAQRQRLALGGHPRLDEHGADGGADDVRLAHVADAEQEARVAVAPTHHRRPAEEDGVRAALRARQLGEDEARDERLDKDADARLQHEEERRLGARRRHHPLAVADRVLRLDAEEQRRREVVHSGDAGRPRRVAPRRRAHVAVASGDGEPEGGEQQPAGEEGEREEEDDVAPAHVDQRREDVR